MRRPIPLTLAAAGVLGLSLGAVIAAPVPAQAAETDIRINEVSSNSATSAPDFVELTNIGSEPVTVTGWILRDNDNAHGVVLPETIIAPGAFLIIEPDEGPDGFGLGSNDEARLFATDGITLVDSYAWTDHAFSEGRLPDGTGEFTDTEPTPGAANVEREAPAFYDADETIAVNEVMSDDPDGGEDWVELVNTGTGTVDLSGWILRDDDDLSALEIADGTELEPGAFLVVETNVTDAGFGLGKADEIRLYVADGLGQVDSYSWTDHAFTEGRIPDGTGTFVDTNATPGSANVARDPSLAVVINEVESNGDPRGDWVELANTDQAQTADVTGWTLVDGDPTHAPIVLAGEIESGGYLGILTEPHFGLGGQDSVTLRDETGTVVASLAWENHATATIGRCPDLTGPFGDTSEGTFELVNACEEIPGPEVVASPWPFENDVRDAVAPGTWGEDMSGLDIAADGTVYAVNNDNAEIFELAGPGAAGESYTIARSWLPSYPGGAGQPDAEGLTVAGDGAIFLSTERDNTASGTSRPSVLRVELGDEGATSTTHEWNLTSITGALGANAGLEGIEWISDADATSLGVRDAAGATYDPAAYDEHFGGIFAVAVEQTGAVHLVVLEADGATTLLQTAQATESVPVLMGLDWRAGGNELWGLCDEACENRSSVFAFDDGVLTWQVDHHAPTGMNTSFTNEGLAFAWCAVDPSAAPTTLWISDAAHDGVSLRVAEGGTCAPAGPGEPGPTDPEPTAPTGPTAPSVDELTDDTRGGVTGPATAEPGETVTFTVPGAAGATVHVWLLSDPVLLGTLTVAADDTFRVTIPADATVGRHRIVVQAENGALMGWAELEIVAADDGLTGPGAGPGGAGLAATGVDPDVAGLTLAAIASVLLGAAALIARRRMATGRS
ncbi:lamin tail domain-containing protein [Occultella gossypii]|uniref:Lamin tail domain-containing protein n=1 Tax=Occultella gossypii TaxID=2800820 RepID=A0ABS7SHJ5_9MICO|nr:lamin tail domain-containing protein [Occultella gossypii]MBZ2198761.1 lamin tail domain-containing protein [Occultella gossypii]